MNKTALKSAMFYLLAALKWLFAAGALGALCGVLGAVFHEGIDLATAFRQDYPLIIWLLPLAGVLTLSLYRLCKVSFSAGTNLIIQSVTTNEHIPAPLAPLIVLGTLLSHLFGASVGREGAALQLGGSIGHNLGERLGFDESDVRVLSMCGMAGCFSAMFGTPITAAIFVLEVICVGTLQHSAFLPCVTCSCSAWAPHELYPYCRYSQIRRHGSASGTVFIGAVRRGRYPVVHQPALVRADLG